MSTRFEGRFSVARSVPPLGWGIAFLGGGLVLEQIAGRLVGGRLIEGDVEYGELYGLGETLFWLGFLAKILGLIYLVVGAIYLAGNIDYLAAREAERHHDAVNAEKAAR